MFARPVTADQPFCKIFPARQSIAPASQSSGGLTLCGSVRNNGKNFFLLLIVVLVCRKDEGT
jgi:hypothetical protein